MLYLELSRFGQLSVSGWALPWQPRASRDNCRARVHARSTQVWPSQSEREGAVTEHTSTRVAGLRVQTRLRTVRAVTAAAWPSPLKFSRLGQWQEPRGRMGGRGWEPLSDLDTDISQLWAHYVYHLTHHTRGLSPSLNTQRLLLLFFSSQSWTQPWVTALLSSEPRRPGKRPLTLDLERLSSCLTL